MPTRAEIQTNKYREKKGLPPLKRNEKELKKIWNF